MVQETSVHEVRPAEAALRLPAGHAESLATNGFYSPLFRELIERLPGNAAALERRLDLGASDVNEFMHHYDCKVNTWPVVIGRDLVASFDRFARTFPRLMGKAITGYFGSDTQKFADYMNLPGLLLELINGTPIDTRQLLIRYDAVFSGDVFKIVEVNAGSNIGGWQLDWLESNFRKTLHSVVDPLLWKVHYRSATRCMLTALVNVLTRAFAAPRGNVLFFVDEQGDRRILDQFRCQLQALYREIAQPRLPEAKLLFFSDLAELTFPADGTVTIRGERVECLVLNLPVGVNVGGGIALKMLSSFLAGKVVYPDSPLHSVFGNKLGLALLHEPEVMALFSAEEQQFVAAHVPWAARTVSARVVWNGHEHAPEALLRAHKDRFVLKKARSFQGLDVVIGRFTDTSAWNERVAHACRDDDWLVQEYCVPDRVVTFDHELGFCPFEFVWGLFHFDDAYGGAFVRGVPAAGKAPDPARSGVINSARGAREFAVFEADRKQQILL